MIFIGTSNEFGAFESGATAQLLGTIPAVMLGESELLSSPRLRGDVSLAAEADELLLGKRARTSSRRCSALSLHWLFFPEAARPGLRRYSPSPLLHRGTAADSRLNCWLEEIVRVSGSVAPASSSRSRSSAGIENRSSRLSSSCATLVAPRIVEVTPAE